MLKKFLIIFATLSTTLSFSQSIESPYELGTWKGFANAAITYTFDDWCANQNTIAIPMLNEYNFDATFFPVINWSPNWSALQNAVNNGHEVGSHTVSHANLGGLTDDKQIEELNNSKTEINTKIATQKCITIAYPFCAPGKQSIVENYFISARHCQGNIELKTPSNFYYINSMVCGTEGSIKTAQDFQTKADAAATSNGWCVYLIHGIDNDGGYSSLSSSVLRESLVYLNNNKSKFWVSTFGNVTKYIRERNCVKLSVASTTADTIIIQLTDTLNNDIYNYPITFRRPLPDLWSNAIVKQNGIQVEYKIIAVNTSKYIEFNAIPDKGLIQICKSTEIINSAIDLDKHVEPRIFPIPFNESLKIKVPGIFNYEILSINGSSVDRGQAFESVDAGTNILPGLYILKLNTKSGFYSKIIIKNQK